MSDGTGEKRVDTTEQLAADGYWPARAAKALREGRFSRAVEICRPGLEADPALISARLIYAQALFHAGQTETAAEELHRVLIRDPDNQVALKYLADIKFLEGDEFGAMACYGHILETDPGCGGLKAVVRKPPAETTRTITLRRESEKTTTVRSSESLRRIPLFTETMGDLYLKQGYPRLAAEVFRTLSEKNEIPRLAEKLAQATESIKQKEG